MFTCKTCGAIFLAPFEAEIIRRGGTCETCAVQAVLKDSGLPPDFNTRGFGG